MSWKNPFLSIALIVAFLSNSISAEREEKLCKFQVFQYLKIVFTAIKVYIIYHFYYSKVPIKRVGPNK